MSGQIFPANRADPDQTAPLEQSDQGLQCLLFHFHHFEKIPYGLASFFSSPEPKAHR